MKVICIDDAWRPGNIVNPSGFEVKDGLVYNVIKTWIGEMTKKPVYALAEDPCKYGYAVDRFVPVSSIDETTFERNYQKETV